MYLVDKVLVPRRLDIGSTTFLKMFNTLEMVLNTLSMVERPYMGWRSINDPFCGLACFDGVIVP